MAPSVVVVRFGGRATIFRLETAAQLREAVAEAFGGRFEADDDELCVCFRWRGTSLEIVSEQSLATYLDLFRRGEAETQDNGLPVVDVVRRPRISRVPTIEEVRSVRHGSLRRAPESTATFDPPFVESVSYASSNSLRGSSGQSQAPTKAALPSGESPKQQPSKVWSSGPKTNEQNRATARNLLASFRLQPEAEEAVLRVVMRDGSGSSTIAFDPANPPTTATVRQRVWAVMGQTLEERVGELRLSREGKAFEERTGKRVVATNFLLSFRFDACDATVDLEDSQDRDVLAQAVRHYGQDNVQLLVDTPALQAPQDAQLRPASPLKVQPEGSRRGLQANPLRTPLRNSAK